MVVPLQLFGSNPLGELALLVIVPTLVVAFGAYVGVLMALQTFFGASSWAEVQSETDDE
ncbi:hypothetical protein [Halorientalis litorea]|jgi:hypothetical protein|uniref:hypothetical protein n=1 Tax=Halorientalis litorea TaxID=2931977 RepID=UPI001FF49B05|nr:hypothetical protein [Halorientalis litorea]